MTATSAQGARRINKYRDQLTTAVPETALTLPRSGSGTPGTVLPYKSQYARAGGYIRKRCPSRPRARYRVQFRRRRKRGGDGFNYTEAMLLIDPATAARIGLTARSKTTPGLFDQVEQTVLSARLQLAAIESCVRNVRRGQSYQPRMHIRGRPHIFMCGWERSASTERSHGSLHSQESINRAKTTVMYGGRATSGGGVRCICAR